MHYLHSLLLISVLTSLLVYPLPVRGGRHIRIKRETDLCYGSVFDAGSSATRVNVYSWDCRETA